MYVKQHLEILSIHEIGREKGSNYSRLHEQFQQRYEGPMHLYVKKYVLIRTQGEKELLEVFAGGIYALYHLEGIRSVSSWQGLIME